MFERKKAYECVCKFICRSSFFSLSSSIVIDITNNKKQFSCYQRHRMDSIDVWKS